jgi:hypothetical protein
MLSEVCGKFDMRRISELSLSSWVGIAEFRCEKKSCLDVDKANFVDIKFTEKGNETQVNVIHGRFEKADVGEIFRL